MSNKLDEFRMTAEWEPQKSVWIAWPHNEKDWPGLFTKIPYVIGKIIKTIGKNQKVELIVYNNKEKNYVKKYLEKLG